jgi:hypothetical protein
MTKLLPTQDRKTVPAHDSSVRPPTGRKVDWDAVERDYRTGKFTLRELAGKHGGSHQAISKQIEKNRWTQDLSVAIRVATNAKLVQDLVNHEVAKGGQAVANTVLAAAELNRTVILGHRTRLVDLAEAVAKAKAKLMTLGDTVSDIRESAIFVQAVGNLATATKTLIGEERRAFNLDDDTSQRESTVSLMTDAEVAVRLAFLMDKAGHR